MNLPPQEAQTASWGPRKLGRKAIKTDSRTLAFGDYLTPALPPPPPAADWTKGIASWGMMLNSALGDCTIAGVGHAVQVWTANTGSMVTVPDPTIESYYEQWDGYVPGNPGTDNGGVELDVLNDWQKTGFAGHALLAFADPEPSSLVEIQQSIALFGGVYIGLALPLTAQTQEVWDVVPPWRRQGQSGQLGRALRLCAQVRPEGLHLHHLGPAEDHDPGFLEEVLRRGPHPSGTGLAQRQGFAGRLRPGPVAGRSEGHCLSAVTEESAGCERKPAPARPQGSPQGGLIAMGGALPESGGVLPYSRGGNPKPMSSFRCFAFLLALSLPAMHVIQAQSSSSSSNPANPTQDQAQQPAAENQGQVNVQARIKARREQRRTAAIHDAYLHLYEAYAGAGYLRFVPGPTLMRLNEYNWNAGLTRYLNERLGVTLEGRGTYGTAFIKPEQGNPPAGASLTKPAISQYAVLLGSSYRFYLQPKYSIAGRVMGGYAQGDFTGDTNGFGTLGVLYPDGKTYAAEASVLVEYNLATNIGLRLAPEYLVTGFGSTTQHSLGYTASVVYRFGKQ
jgi:hypothetical protein